MPADHAITLLPKSLPILPLRSDLGNSLMYHSGVHGLILKVLLSMMKILSQNCQSGDRKGTEVQLCVCKKQNPNGLMMQCDSCRDWLHPKCVGITAKIAERIPLYTYQEFYK